MTSTLAEKADRTPATTGNGKMTAAETMVEVKRKLDVYSPVLRNLLPDGNVDRFKGTVANALRKNPQLLGCTVDSILGSALRSAQLGLEPNDSRNLCHFVPYGGVCTWQLGYGGVIELLRRAVPGVRVEGRAVFPNDQFDISFDEGTVTHRPHVVANPGAGRGGDAYYWYVRVTFPDGNAHVHGLDREGVEYHRSFSKQKNGEMWAKSYDAAALKSTVLDMRRWLPQSVELALALASDDQVIDIGEVTQVDRDPFTPAAELPTASIDPDAEITDVAEAPLEVA